MANLYNSSLIPNITEIYYGSDGQVLQQDGNGLFHAQNNYSNLLYVYIEDGNGENTTTLINFSPKKFQSTIKPAFTSHWFFMSYRGLVQQTIEGEDAPRSFAQFAIVIPNTVLRYNSLSLTQNTVTVVQRYGESFLGVYSDVSDLNNSYGDDTIYSPTGTEGDLNDLLSLTPTPSVNAIYEVTANTFNLPSEQKVLSVSAMLNGTWAQGDIIQITPLNIYYQFTGQDEREINDYTLIPTPATFSTTAYKYTGTAVGDFNNWEHVLTPENLAEGLYTAYLTTPASFYQMELNGTYAWTETTTISSALQTKQYNTFDISVQNGLASTLDVPTATVSQTDFVLNEVSNITQQYVDTNNLLVSHISDTANPHGTRISNLDDTAITNPTNGQIARYSSVSQKWENSSTLTTAESNIGDLQSRMGTAEGEIDTLQSQMTTAQGDITSLEGRMDTAEADIVSLEGRMTTAEGDIDTLETNVSSNDVDIAALDVRVTTNESDISNLESGKVSIDASIVGGVSATDYIYAAQGTTPRRITVDNLKASIIENLVAFGYVVFTEKDVDGQPVVASPQTNKIYLYNPTDSDIANDQYEEWIYVEDDLSFEQIGTTAIALQDYYTAAQLDAGQLDNRYFTETEITTNYDTSAEVDAKVDIPLRLQVYPNTKNMSGVAIPKGAVVQFAGSQGDFIEIKEAVASEINANPSLLMGLAREQINDDAFGDVVWFGNVLEVATGSFSLGDILWFDTVSGGLTNVEPSDDKIQIAAVEKASSNPTSTNGILLVRIKYVTRQIGDVSGLQTALDGKVDVTGDTMTGKLNVGVDSGSIQEWKRNSEGYNRASVDFNGGFRSDNGIANITDFDRASVTTGTTGTTISRNIADANPALVVNQANASSTGRIVDFKFDDVSQSFLNPNGNFFARAFFDINNSSYYLDPANTGTSLNVAGIIKGLALHTGDAGDGSTALGVEALLNDDGSDNRNTAVGYQTLRSNTTGSYNTANGYQALRSNTTGSYNTASGYQALLSNTTGNSNTASGIQAGRFIADGSTGNTTGDYNTFIGTDTKALADNDQNETVIGYNAIGNGSNTVTIGNDNVTDTYLKGDVQTSGSVTGSNITSTTLTLGSFTLEYNEATNSLNFNFNE